MRALFPFSIVLLAGTVYVSIPTTLPPPNRQHILQTMRPTEDPGYPVQASHDFFIALVHRPSASQPDLLPTVLEYVGRPA